MTPPRLEVFISGIGVLGPGLPDWPTTRALLTGNQTYAASPTALPVPLLLPPAERRRTGQAIKLSLAIGLEAIADAGLDAATLATVFTSSGGDGDNCHAICEALASDDRQISPTRFHNSVHNATAGYWSIATGAMAPSNCLCAYDASFAAGLIEAATQVLVERVPVLLLAYDTGYPQPLRAKRPLGEPFGIALALTPEAPVRGWQISCELADGAPDALADPALETLRRSVPAARALPLLAALARGGSGTCVIEAYDDRALAVRVTSC